MKVSWSKRAAKSAQTTATFIYKEFGNKASQKFLLEIAHVSQLLEDNPYLGPIEPLLLNKKNNTGALWLIV
ncbi:MAG: type II toxin-antitoxin system RelE/ParE family toxin [Bacteroidales bacterium]|nr:type II toxin-antitoxin system RelE/ParE family toxin [Bacteroidales bacterium]